MHVQTIAARAADYRPARALLTVVAAPFWLLGALAALVWVALTWCYAAGVTGWSDTRTRVAPDVDVEV